MDNFEARGIYEIDRSAVEEFIVDSLFDDLRRYVENGFLKLHDAYRIREQFMKSAELQRIVDHCITQTITELNHDYRHIH